MHRRLPDRRTIDRTVTHVDRTTVAAPRDLTFARLRDLPRTVGTHTGLDFDGWPHEGLAGVATFRLEHGEQQPIAYEVSLLEEPYALALRATGPRWTADHVVHVLDGHDEHASQVTWQVTLSSDQPVGPDVVQDATALSTAALQALRD